MRLGAGGVLCDDESFPSGGPHAGGQFGVWNKVAAIDPATAGRIATIIIAKCMASCSKGAIRV
jgi:hypothetical protein